MVFPRYLAQTPTEFLRFPPDGFLPALFAGNPEIPETALLILTDRVPFSKEAAESILGVLKKAAGKFSSLLLDFQRPGISVQQHLAEVLSGKLPCPVGVSEPYAENLSGPVFLSPAPLHIPFAEYAESWNGRELWLDLPPLGESVTVTEQGANSRFLPDSGFPAPFAAESLFCHYGMTVSEDSAVFSFRRTPEDLQVFLEALPKFGVTRTVGLFQEWHKMQETALQKMQSGL